jgi:hypothetical protein
MLDGPPLPVGDRVAGRAAAAPADWAAALRLDADRPTFRPAFLDDGFLLTDVPFDVRLRVLAAGLSSLDDEPWAVDDMDEDEDDDPCDGHPVDDAVSDIGQALVAIAEVVVGLDAGSALGDPLDDLDLAACLDACLGSPGFAHAFTAQLDDDDRPLLEGLVASLPGFGGHVCEHLLEDLISPQRPQAH